MPSRHCRGGRPARYSPVRTEDTVIYATVDKGKKFHRKKNERNPFNSSSDSSVRETEGDNVSVETPLVTSEDGRSSTHSEDSKYNAMRSIKCEDRESRV